MAGVSDNPIEHVEGGPDCRWLKVRMTPELLRQWAASQGCDVTLHPEPDGFVVPVFTKHDYRAVASGDPDRLEL